MSYKAILLGACFIPVHVPTPPPVVIPPPVIVVVPTPPPSIVVVPPTPVVVSSGGGGGNGQIWCSGPSAPGWNVSLPGGGCNTPVNQCVPITDFKVTNLVKGDGKAELWWKGSGYVNVWKKEKGVISHYYMKSTGYFQVKTQGADFWMSNECSQTPRIDP